jgi:hypothetical protein
VLPNSDRSASVVSKRMLKIPVLLRSSLWSTHARPWKRAPWEARFYTGSEILQARRTPRRCRHVLRDYLLLVVGVAGNGNESGVDWRSAEETDQNPLVVDAVDNRRSDSIRIIN